MQGSCQVHNAIRSVPLHSALHMHRTRMQYCADQHVQLCSKAQNVTLYFAVYCIGRMVHRRWQTAAGWHQEGLGGPGGSWASPPNTEMENINVRKYYHSSQSVLYTSTPHTVWRIELMCNCEVCSVGSGLQQRITRTTITMCVPSCTNQHTSERGLHAAE